MPISHAIPVVPDSKSIILRSTHVVVVAVEAATPGPWAADGNRFQVRSVECRFKFEELRKGQVHDAIGDTCKLTVRQWKSTSPRTVALPGSWSGKELGVGSRWVVFSTSPGVALPTLLAEPQAEKVNAFTEARSDLDLVAQAGAPPLPVADLIQRTFDRRAAYGPLFAEYLSARLSEVLFERLEDFAVVMRLIADGQLSAQARWILITGVYSEFLLRDPAPMPFVERLVSETLALLAQPGGEALRVPMLETYVPNLLALEGGAEPKSADAVFEQRVGERERTRRLLSDSLSLPAAHPLLVWIQKHGHP